MTSFKILMLLQIMIHIHQIYKDVKLTGQQSLNVKVDAERNLENGSQVSVQLFYCIQWDIIKTKIDIAFGLKLKSTAKNACFVKIMLICFGLNTRLREFLRNLQIQSSKISMKLPIPIQNPWYKSNVTPSKNMKKSCVRPVM